MAVAIYFSSYRQLLFSIILKYDFASFIRQLWDWNYSEQKQYGTVSALQLQYHLVALNRKEIIATSSPENSTICFKGFGDKIERQSWAGEERVKNIYNVYLNDSYLPMMRQYEKCIIIKIDINMYIYVGLFLRSQKIDFYAQNI